MANTSPIDTQTRVRRIPLTNSIDTTIRQECDTMGGAGYQLTGCFESSGNLVLIFQLTR